MGNQGGATVRVRVSWRVRVSVRVRVAITVMVIVIVIVMAIFMFRIRVGASFRFRVRANPWCSSNWTGFGASFVCASSRGGGVDRVRRDGHGYGGCRGGDAVDGRHGRSLYQDGDWRNSFARIADLTNGRGFGGDKWMRCECCET